MSDVPFTNTTINTQLQQQQVTKQLSFSWFQTKHIIYSLWNVFTPNKSKQQNFIYRLNQLDHLLRTYDSLSWTFWTHFWNTPSDSHPCSAILASRPEFVFWRELDCHKSTRPGTSPSRQHSPWQPINQWELFWTSYKQMNRNYRLTFLLRSLSAINENTINFNGTGRKCCGSTGDVNA